MIMSLILIWSDLSPMMWFGLKIAQIDCFCSNFISNISIFNFNGS